MPPLLPNCEHVTMLLVSLKNNKRYSNFSRSKDNCVLQHDATTIFVSQEILSLLPEKELPLPKRRTHVPV
jgi:hypothetical protein